jgi:uncharacterized caspase-like protein
VNNYSDKGLHYQNYAENDATHFASLLSDVGYRVVLMTQATGKLDPMLAPTKTNIEAQITALVEKRKTKDVVILSLAGHGFEFDKDPDAYFCPVDAVTLADKKSTLISLDGIYTQLGQCRAETKLLLADCYRNESNVLRKRGANDTLSKLPPKGVLVLHSCTPNERSYEFAKLKQGVFFYHLTAIFIWKTW